MKPNFPASADEKPSPVSNTTASESHNPGVVYDSVAAVGGIRPTPETDAEPKWGDWQGCEIVPANFTRQLERQRDELRDALMAIEERYTDGENTYEDWKFMGDTARASLQERENQ